MMPLQQLIIVPALQQRIIVPGDEASEVNKIETDFVPLASGGVDMILECAFFCVLTGLWTALRLWSRRLRGVGICLEDWLHLSALVFYYGQVSTCIASVFVGGAGHHVDELQEWHIVRFSKLVFLTEILYSLSTGLVKISIAVMLMRIFVTRNVQIAGIFIVVYSALWVLHPLFTGLLVCKPIEMNWNPETPGGTCGNQYIGFGLVAALDIVNELFLLILPIPSLLKLHLNRRYKIALAGVFCTGIITLIVAILRIPILLQTDFSDLTYDTRSQMLAVAEPGVAIIVSCSPLLKPLYDKAIALFPYKTMTNDSQELESPVSYPVRNRRQFRESSHGYTQFGSSNDFYDMDNLGSTCKSRGVEILAEGHPSGETSENGNLGIVVVKETIVSRDDNKINP